jgi:hypothetical protein
LNFNHKNDNDLLFDYFIDQIKLYQLQKIEDKKEKKLKVNKNYIVPNIVI